MQDELASERAKKKKIQERLYWRCRRKARIFAWFLSVFIGLLLMAGLAAGLGLRSSNQILGWLLTAGVGVVLLLTLGNLIMGSTVQGLHERVQQRCLKWLIKREAIVIGLNLEDTSEGS